jgi:hypothetical protein
MVFNIGGVLINYIGVNEYFINRSSSFISDSEPGNVEYDMEIKFDLCDNVEIPDGDEIFSDNETIILKKRYPENGFYIYLDDFERRRKSLKAAVIDVNDSWSKVILRYIYSDRIFATTDNGKRYIWAQFHSFLSMGIVYRNYLIKNEGIQIHSSSIEFEDKAIIFSAPSGTGKSTHVALWKELYGDMVSIVNEDRPCIRYIDKVPMVCGTPWSGTSDNFTNKIVPLKAIVMLEQAKDNSMEKLPSISALPLLMPRCFMPYFDQEMMNEAMDTLERLINDVPIYLLKCRPDYEAVELVRKCVI